MDYLCIVVALLLNFKHTHIISTSDPDNEWLCIAYIHTLCVINRLKNYSPVMLSGRQVANDGEQSSKIHINGSGSVYVTCTVCSDILLTGSYTYCTFTLIYKHHYNCIPLTQWEQTLFCSSSGILWNNLWPLTLCPGLFSVLSCLFYGTQRAQS